MRTMLDAANRGIQVVVGLIFLVIFALFVVQIGLRYFLGTTWLWAPDVIRLLFIWGVFLGTTVLFHMHAHLSMAYFVADLAPASRRRLDIRHHLAHASFFPLVTVRACELSDSRQLL